MDGISMISARMVEIETRFSQLAPPRPAAVATAPSRSAAVFDQALSLAVAETSPVEDLSSATASWAPGGVPADLARYGNGQVPSDALMDIDGTGNQLWTPAAPGTSDHGWGTALDLSLDAKAQSWMQTNTKQYGFVDSTPREPWHWIYTK